MTLVELTEPPESALPLARLREHLRLSTGFLDDSLQDPLLTGFLRAAISAIEGRTGKALLDRTFALTLGDWVSSDRQPLPVAPVSVVASVTLTDGGGTQATVPSTAWRLDPNSARPTLAARGTQLPPSPGAAS